MMPAEDRRWWVAEQRYNWRWAALAGGRLDPGEAARGQLPQVAQPEGGSDSGPHRTANGCRCLHRC